MARENIAQIDEFIRQGNLPAARQLLGTFQKRAVPREFAQPLANLARRAGLPNLALRLLNPIVRPPARSRIVATDGERAEYAACLSRIGAGGEALDILERLDKTKVPEASLYEAHVLITRWNYEGSIPLLQAYIAAPGIDAYPRTVAKVNLVAAFVTERKSEAAGALAELLAELDAPNFAFLRALTFELAAEHAIFGKRWREAETHLAASAKLLRDTESLEAFFVRKWEAVLALLRAPKSERAREGMAAIRAEANRRHHWETLRDCDRFVAIATRDERLLHHVYFGTPFESFRRRLLLDFGATAPLPERYEWNLAGKGRPRAIDLVTCAALPLRAGQLLHRLTLALASDFYRPTRLASLHAAIYPGEFFNPVSSPTRVHQAVKRLKRELATAKIPLALREENGSYSLVATTACRVRLPGAGGLPPLLAALRERIGAADFSARELAKAGGLSSRTARRLLLDAKENGWIERDGVGSSTRYRFIVEN